MGSFLLVVVAALVVGGIIFGAAAFTLGRDRGLTPPRPDGVPYDLPSDRPIDRLDIERLRFDTTVRGYQMDQVDAILDRVSDDLDFLANRIADLEDQLAERVDEVGDELSWDEPAEELTEMPETPENTNESTDEKVDENADEAEKVRSPGA